MNLARVYSVLGPIDARNVGRDALLRWMALFAVNRLADKTAACKTGRYAQVASYFAHFGEEDCLRGWRGSGTIFFSMCNLRCVFCQNYDISQANKSAELADFSLYHLIDDPAETTDRKESEGGVFAAMRAEMRRLYAEVRAESPAWAEWEWPRYEGQRIEWPEYKALRKPPK